MTFKRETKYLVLKWDDVNKYLNENGQGWLRAICNAIHEGREREGKKENTYVVVNEDEPYAEIVWELIELYEEFKENLGAVN